MTCSDEPTDATINQDALVIINAYDRVEFETC